MDPFEPMLNRALRILGLTGATGFSVHNIQDYDNRMHNPNYFQFSTSEIGIGATPEAKNSRGGVVDLDSVAKTFDQEYYYSPNQPASGTQNTSTIRYIHEVRHSELSALLYIPYVNRFPPTPSYCTYDTTKVTVRLTSR